MDQFLDSLSTPSTSSLHLNQSTDGDSEETFLESRGRSGERLTEAPSHRDATRSPRLPSATNLHDKNVPSSNIHYIDDHVMQSTLQISRELPMKQSFKKSQRTGRRSLSEERHRFLSVPTTIERNSGRTYRIFLYLFLSYSKELVRAIISYPAFVFCFMLNS
jgi:hypothetical protein